MSARNGTGLSWLRLAGLALASFASQASHSQEASVVEESAAQRLSDGRSRYAQLDYAGARQSFDAAVSLIESRAGTGSVELVEPLAELGRTLLALRQPDQAGDALRRAVTIIRRSDGLYGVRQYPLLIELVDIDSGARRLDDANSGLQQALRVVERAYRDDWRARARALHEVGDWQCRIGDFVDARRTYRQALAALESRDDELLRVEAMTALARCSLLELSSEGIETAPGTFEHYRGKVQRTGRMSPESPTFRLHVSRVLRWEAEQALRRAAAIAESGRLEPRQAMGVLLLAGDWFQTKDHYRAARAYYARVDEIAASLSAESPLGAPVQLLYPLPPFVLRGRGATSADDVARSVDVEFRVQADGRVDGEKVIARDLGKSMVDEVLNALSVARYRPRFEAGEAVDTEGVRLRQPIPDFK